MARVRLFSHLSNPAIDPPTVRKSHSYVQQEVDAGRAMWLTPDSAIAISPDRSLDFTHFAAGSGFDSSWSTRMSGYAGPLVWQLKTPRIAIA